MNLETAPGGGSIVAERPAVSCPQVAIVIHAETMSLHDHAVAEALGDLPIGINVIDRWFGARTSANRRNSLV